MTQKTLTTILDEHRLRMTTAGELVFDARPIADALDFLNANTCLELDHTEIDGWMDDCQWRVRACHGGRNDPEWTTITVAPTVEAALIKTYAVGKV